VPAQGTALGIGSRVENSNALKGQNRFVVKSRILFRPFRAGRIFIRIRSPGRCPGLSVSAPSGRQKSATPKLAKGGKENGVLATVANRNETGRKTHTHNPRVRRSAIRHRNSDFTGMFESQVPASWAGLVRTPSMRIAPFSLMITAKTNGLSA
jgi:hypothetical protein